MNTLLSKSGIVLAIAFLLCLFPLPYGCYMILRFVAMIYFLCLAYYLYKEEKQLLCIVAGSLALLFQPFLKISLGKSLWDVVDVIVAIALLLFWYNNKNNYFNMN